jgi:outer membrane protein assembly factor BamD
MNRSARAILILLALLLLPFRSPAQRNNVTPESGGLTYRPGEGWSYETPGSDVGQWQKTRAKDQLEVAQQAFDKKNYGLALKASRRITKVWPNADSVPPAQYLIGRCYEARSQDERAFNAYQQLLEKHPKVVNYQEIQQRQFEIATRFLKGQWFKLFNYIPAFPSMEKTADMFEKIIKNGPYSPISPEAQMSIGAAREKQKEFPQAVKAYERAADRYSEQQKVSADALFKAGLAYQKQAKTADYDQNIAGQAVTTFIDFIALHPDDSRVAEAHKIITSLKSEQARGNFQIAKFYEKGKHLHGAKVYYNEVLQKDAGSPLATEARQRIDSINQRTEQK